MRCSCPSSVFQYMTKYWWNTAFPEGFGQYNSHNDFTFFSRGWTMLGNTSRFSLSKFLQSPSRVFILALFMMLLVGVAYLNGTKPLGSSDVYTHQQSYVHYKPEGNQYRIFVVSDMDSSSKIDNNNKWRSVLKQGELKRDDGGTYSIAWKEEVQNLTLCTDTNRKNWLENITKVVEAWNCLS